MNTEISNAIKFALCLIVGCFALFAGVIYFAVNSENEIRQMFSVVFILASAFLLIKSGDY
jgi:hypothetical protein